MPNCCCSVRSNANNRNSRPRRMAPRSLRVGVVQGGVLVEERVFPASARRITVGSSTRARLVLPGSQLPASRTLFELRADRCKLRLDLPIDGRVASEEGGEVRTIAELRAAGGRAVELGARARGKLQLGELTLLFQRVAAIESPRPRLPPSVRGGLLGRVDWTLAASFVALIVLHAGGLALLNTVEVPRLQPSALPDGFVEKLPRAEPPRGITVQGLLDVGEKPIAKQPAPRAEEPRRRPGRTRAGRPSARLPRSGLSLARQVERLGALAILGHRGRDREDAVRNLLRAGRPDEETERAFRGVTGVTVSARGNRDLRPSGGTPPGRRVTIDDLDGRFRGPGRVGTGEAVTEREPRAIVMRERVKTDKTLRPVDVERVIRLGMPAVTACFQRGIKRNPDLGGKTLIRIEVNALGAVTGVSVDDDSMGDAQVNACIASYARRWRFPAPEGGGRAEVVVPFLFRSAPGR